MSTDARASSVPLHGSDPTQLVVGAWLPWRTNAIATEGVITVIGFLVAGLIIGALARLIKPGKQDLGILATLGLGLVGSLIGGLVAQLFGTGSIWELNVLGFILAVVAAVLLVGTAETLTGRTRTSSS
jgi:uncharacterized membrane protein YeaQ/YmgE (transglycosylase-associated protein family)